MEEKSQFLGIVKNGRLQLLQPASLANTTVRISTFEPQQAWTPEAVEIDLTSYEGQAIMVRGSEIVQGREGGDWIYSAEIIDQVRPILSAVVEKLFNK